jgi:hypothetical protein
VDLELLLLAIKRARRHIESGQDIGSFGASASRGERKVANDGHFRAVTGVVARLVVHDDVEEPVRAFDTPMPASRRRYAQYRAGLKSHQ